MGQNKWYIGLALFSLALVLMGPQTIYGQRNSIIVVEGNFSSSVAVSHILKVMFESKLNIPMETKRMAAAIAFPGMEKGEVDVYTELWWPNSAEMMEKYYDQGKKVEGTVLYENCEQGIYVPTWVSKKYGITEIMDLNKHSEMFDFDRDKIGDIWAGSRTWRSTEITIFKVKGYGLNLTPYVVEQWAFLAQFIEGMRKQKPMVFYYWTPEWLFAKYDLTLLKEPPFDPNKWKYVEGDFKNSNVLMQLQPAKVYISYSTSLKDRLPKAYKFFKNFYIPKDEVNNLIMEIEEFPDKLKKDPMEVAKKWISEHPDIVNNWLKGVQ